MYNGLDFSTGSRQPGFPAPTVGCHAFRILPPISFPCIHCWQPCFHATTLSVENCEVLHNCPQLGPLSLAFSPTVGSLALLHSYLQLAALLSCTFVSSWQPCFRALLAALFSCTYCKQPRLNKLPTERFAFLHLLQVDLFSCTQHLNPCLISHPAGALVPLTAGSHALDIHT